MANVLQIENLTKSFGTTVLFEGISLQIDEGQKTGLIGVNGSGKSSLLDIVAGRRAPDSGVVRLAGNIRTGYLEQNPVFPAHLSVMQACMLASAEGRPVGEDYERELRAKRILSQLKVSYLDSPAAELSGGQLKRVALAKVLIDEPDLLILDEPTNHLDLETVEWLEEYLDRSKLALLMVTHDRYFLDRVCNGTVEIDERRLFHYKGNYSYYLEKRRERIELRNSERERAANLLRGELEWMRRQPKARGTKAKYRIDAFHELEERAKPAEVRRESLTLNARRNYTGTKIFEARHVSKRFGDKVILNDFNYVFSRFEKTGITGDNGTGKSTFVKLLLGELTPDEGVFDVGETVRFGYYSQSGPAFDEGMKVIDAVRNIAEYVDAGGGKRLSAAQLLDSFMFPRSRQFDFIGKLSGGERKRLYLCTVLMRNPNFLILDEPTNDLDILTLNSLEEYLREFDGCLILISHDRYFTDKIVDHLFVFKGNGEIKDFPGNYSDYRDSMANEEAEREKAARQEKAGTEKAVQEKSGQKSGQEKSPAKRKLSFREQREFESLEGEIEALEAEKREIERALGETSDAEELQRRSERFSELLDLIETKTDRWLELGTAVEQYSQFNHQLP